MAVRRGIYLPLGVGGRGKCHDFVHKSAVIIVSNHGHAAVT